jgi:1,4-dihydroxy-2-naphthoate octaprenyltransferase
MITGLFQGLFTFLMCYAGMNRFSLENLLQEKVLLAGLLTSVMLWANYPMTQVYQHEEDARRGDQTLSLVLGIRGTFLFTGAFFLLATTGFFWFFRMYYESKYAWNFFFWLSPAVLYFMYWFVSVLRDEGKADFRHTMWLNFVSSTCLIIFFVLFFLSVSHLGS